MWPGLGWPYVQMCPLPVGLGEVVEAYVSDGPWSAGRGVVLGPSAEMCTSESVCVHSCEMLEGGNV